MDWSTYGLQIIGPNYRDELDGRDAKVKWRFPSLYDEPPQVKFTFTDVDRNTTFEKTCRSYIGKHLVWDMFCLYLENVISIGIVLDTLIFYH